MMANIYCTRLSGQPTIIADHGEIRRQEIRYGRHGNNLTHLFSNNFLDCVQRDHIRQVAATTCYRTIDEVLTLADNPGSIP
jgi:hypothetical protein